MYQVSWKSVKWFWRRRLLEFFYHIWTWRPTEIKINNVIQSWISKCFWIIFRVPDQFLHLNIGIKSCESPSHQLQLSAFVSTVCPKYSHPKTLGSVRQKTSHQLRLSAFVSTVCPKYSHPKTLGSERQNTRHQLRLSAFASTVCPKYSHPKTLGSERQNTSHQLRLSAFVSTVCPKYSHPKTLGSVS